MSIHVNTTSYGEKIFLLLVQMTRPNFSLPLSETRKRNSNQSGSTQAAFAEQTRGGRSVGMVQNDQHNLPSKMAGPKNKCRCIKGANIHHAHIIILYPSCPITSCNHLCESNLRQSTLSAPFCNNAKLYAARALPDFCRYLQNGGANNGIVLVLLKSRPPWSVLQGLVCQFINFHYPSR